MSRFQVCELCLWHCDTLRLHKVIQRNRVHANHDLARAQLVAIAKELPKIILVRTNWTTKPIKCTCFLLTLTTHASGKPVGSNRCIKDSKVVGSSLTQVAFFYGKDFKLPKTQLILVSMLAYGLGYFMVVNESLIQLAFWISKIIAHRDIVPFMTMLYCRNSRRWPRKMNLNPDRSCSCWYNKLVQLINRASKVFNSSLQFLW